MRVKRGFTARRRRKKVLKQAKGFRGRSKNTIRTAHHRVEKAMEYAYRDRRTKKRDFRRVWIVRVGAAARAAGLSYSQLINGLNKAGVELDRKSLAILGSEKPEAFAAVAELAKAELQ